MPSNKCWITWSAYFCPIALSRFFRSIWSTIWFCTWTKPLICLVIYLLEKVFIDPFYRDPVYALPPCQACIESDALHMALPCRHQVCEACGSNHDRCAIDGMVIYDTVVIKNWTTCNWWLLVKVDLTISWFLQPTFAVFDHQWIYNLMCVNISTVSWNNVSDK